MGTKRKASGTLPATVQMERQEGTAPFAVYFPSGFDPEKSGAECEWETHAHADRANQYAVVAKTVSNSRVVSVQMAIGCWVPRMQVLLPIIGCSRSKIVLPRLPLQAHNVDFLGRNLTAEHSTAASCR